MKMILTAKNSQVAGIAVVYMIFGILLCFFDRTVLVVATQLTGAALIMYGAYLLYTFYYQHNNRTAMPLYVSIPCILFGLVMTISPDSLVNILPVLSGLILILNSTIQIKKSFVLHKYADPNWVIFLGVSVFMLVAGVVLELAPVQSLSFILKLLGTALIVEGIFLLFNVYELQKFKITAY